jgi:UDP-glucose 4-epimerase
MKGKSVVAGGAVDIGYHTVVQLHETEFYVIILENSYSASRAVLY